MLCGPLVALRRAAIGFDSMFAIAAGPALHFSLGSVFESRAARNTVMMFVCVCSLCCLGVVAALALLLNQGGG